MNQQMKSITKTVWCLETPNGKLLKTPYVLGCRNRYFPDWWPTRDDAISASCHHADFKGTPVKVQVTFKRIK